MNKGDNPSEQSSNMANLEQEMHMALELEQEQKLQPHTHTHTSKCCKHCSCPDSIQLQQKPMKTWLIATFVSVSLIIAAQPFSNLLLQKPDTVAPPLNQDDLVVLDLVNGARQTFSEINEKGMLMTDLDDNKITKMCLSYSLHLNEEVIHPYNPNKLLSHYTAICNSNVDETFILDFAFERDNDSSPRYSYTLYSPKESPENSFVKFSPTMEDAARRPYAEFIKLLQSDVDRSAELFSPMIVELERKHELKKKWFGENF